MFNSVVVGADDSATARQAVMVAADIAQLAGASRVFPQIPRLAIIDELIRTVGTPHHKPHGQIVIARFIGGRDLLARFGRFCKQPAIIRICR